ncbi:MAG: hypothetical protein ACI4I1_02525 [Oscillospiraceae bacterium]
MSFNPDTFNLMMKLALGMVAVLLIIWVLAVITPKLAKLTDKILGKAKIDRGDSSVTLENGEKYTVKDIYEGTSEETAEAPENIETNNNEKE